MRLLLLFSILIIPVLVQEPEFKLFSSINDIKDGLTKIVANSLNTIFKMMSFDYNKIENMQMCFEENTSPNNIIEFILHYYKY